jgi:hypothetical protein
VYDEDEPTACADMPARDAFIVTMYRPGIAPGSPAPTIFPTAAWAGTAVPAAAMAAAVSRVPSARIRMAARSVGPSPT